MNPPTIPPTNPMDEFDLPDAPPVTPDVAQRTLDRLLLELDAPHRSRSRIRRWAPLLTAAAAILVAVAVAAVITLSGSPDPATPATSTTAPVEPLPPDQLPPLVGVPGLDTALARCATAVVRGGRAADYPPVTTWRLSPSTFGGTTAQLVVNDAFACLVTVDRVAVSGTTGTPVGGVQVVRMSPTELVVLDPDRRGFTITAGGQLESFGGPVSFLRLDAGVAADQVQITVSGGYAGPLPEPVQALAVTDRLLPAQDPNAPGAGELAACIAQRSTDSPADQARWLLIGRHDVGAAAPSGPIARIDDVVTGTSLAGICVSELDGSDRAFISGLLPPPSDEVQVFQNVPGLHALTLLATVPDGVTGLRMAPQADPAAGQDCTIIAELAVCTLDVADGYADPRIVLTAYTAAEPDGREVYRN